MLRTTCCKVRHTVIVGRSTITYYCTKCQEKITNEELEKPFDEPYLIEFRVTESIRWEARKGSPIAFRVGAVVTGKAYLYANGDIDSIWVKRESGNFQIDHSKVKIISIRLEDAIISEKVGT